MIFTPDSRRLVLGHVQSGSIVVVALPSLSSSSGLETEMEVEVVKCFQMGGNTFQGRVIAGPGNGHGNGNGQKKQRRRNGRGHANANGTVNGVANGEIVDEAMEVEVEEEVDDVEEDEVKEEEDDGKTSKGNQDGRGQWIKCLGASGDGQWLCSGDTAGRVTIFNLDTLQVSSSPNLPHLVSGQNTVS